MNRLVAAKVAEIRGKDLVLEVEGHPALLARSDQVRGEVFVPGMEMRVLEIETTKKRYYSRSSVELLRLMVAEECAKRGATPDVLGIVREPGMLSMVVVRDAASIVLDRFRLGLELRGEVVCFVEFRADEVDLAAACFRSAGVTVLLAQSLGASLQVTVERTSWERFFPRGFLPRVVERVIDRPVQLTVQGLPT